MSSLGDVVLTLPVFQRLRAAYPDAHIAVLVKDAYADVLKGEGAIDEVLTVARGESLLALARRIRQGKFDTVWICTRTSGLGSSPCIPARRGWSDTGKRRWRGVFSCAGGSAPTN